MLRMQLVQEPGSKCSHDCFGAGMDCELGVDAVAVPLDGPGADLESRSDLPVLETEREQPEDGQLALAETLARPPRA